MAAKAAATLSKASKAVWHAVKAVAKAAEKFAAKVIHAVIYGYQESVSINIPIGLGPKSITLTDSPWGDAFRIFHYEDGKSEKNYGIYAANLAKLAGAGELLPDLHAPIGVSKIPVPSVDLFCVGCGVEGKIRTTGSAVFRPIGPIVTNMAITLSGHLTANIALGADAYMSYVATIAKYNILTLGVPGLSIPNIISESWSNLYVASRL